MRTVKRILRVIIACVVGVPLLSLVGGYLHLRSSLAPAGGTLRIAGLQAPVEVVRDRWGVPHVYATGEDDLFFAQGYVQAGDRLWQMELYRRAAAGTLAEVLGERALPSDRLARTLGVARDAAAEWSALDAGTRRAFEAYARGVNAYLEGRHQLPVEFSLLGLTPAPWQPEDSLAIGRLVAWNMDAGWRAEVLRARLVNAVGPERAQELLGEEGLELPEGLIGLAALAQPVLSETAGEGWPWLTGISGGAWVVEGSKTASGGPILAADLYSAPEMPSLWYEMHLVGGVYDVAGASLPGLPGIAVGRNRSIAWAWGAGSADNVDLYVERLRAGSAVQAAYEGGWEDVRLVEERIDVRGRTEPVRVETVITRHGPLVPPFEAGEGEREGVALCWAGWGQATGFGSCLLALNRASSWDEFRAVLQRWTVPARAFLYADTAGNTGCAIAGLVPISPRGDGRLPLPGWVAAYDWTGLVPSDLPSQPSKGGGLVTSLGDALPETGTSGAGSLGSSPTYAATRVSALVEARAPLTADEAMAIAGDLYGPSQPLLSLLLSRPPADWVEQRSLPYLRYWDLQYDAESAGAGIYETFYWRLVHNTLDDELGADLVESYLQYAPAHRRVIEALAREPASPWFDDLRTPEQEDRNAILARSFAEALDWLGRRFGDLPYEWNWGRVHNVTFRHPLGVSWPLTILLNRGAMRAGGAPECVSATQPLYGSRMVVGSLPAYRLIVDLGSGESLALLATGQSGNPVSPHYGDMIEAWREGRFHPLLYERDAVFKAREGVVTLTPAP